MTNTEKNTRTLYTFEEEVRIIQETIDRDLFNGADEFHYSAREQEILVAEEYQRKFCLRYLEEVYDASFFFFLYIDEECTIVILYYAVSSIIYT